MVPAQAFDPVLVMRLHNTTCINLPEVAASVGFTRQDISPYPKLWYDTTIEYEKKCYVTFTDMDANRRCA